MALFKKSHLNNSNISIWFQYFLFFNHSTYINFIYEFLALFNNYAFANGKDKIIY